MDQRQRRPQWLRYLPVIVGATAVMVVIGVLVWLIRGFIASKPPQTQQVIQNITLVRPPPPPETPPPPPPPKVEQQQPLEQKQAEPKPDNTPAPPQPQLGLDAAGTAGGDAFGLLARPGGTDLVGTGGAAFAYYTGKLRDAVSDLLASDGKLHSKKFTVDVRLWIAADGRIKQVRLVQGSGNQLIDQEIASALTSLGRLDEAPPIEMPQPITLQIVGHS